METILFIGAIVAIVVLGFVAQRLGWIDLSNKTKTGAAGGGSALGIGDEVFHPTRHEAQIELDRQTVLPAPAPLAGDSDRGVYRGKVEIELTDDDTSRADDPNFKRSRE